MPPHAPTGIALIAHPHPLYGGTMENKIVQTLARTFAAQGCAAWRLNFRGVGASEGTYDDGRGELDDFRALAAHTRSVHGDLPLTVAGFSFGGYVASHLAPELQPKRLGAVAPAVGRFPVRDVPSTMSEPTGEEDDVVTLEENLACCRAAAADRRDSRRGHFSHGDLIRLQQVVRAHRPDDVA